MGIHYFQISEHRHNPNIIHVYTYAANVSKQHYWQPYLQPNPSQVPPLDPLAFVV